MLDAVHREGLSIDCIVLDYQMPEMNGGDVVAAIKSHEHLSKIPIIMLTSVEETSDGKTFSSLGIQGYFTKPARSSMLLQMLIEVLQEKFQSQTSGDTELVANMSAVQKLIEYDEQLALPETQTKPNDKLEIDVLVCEDNEVNQIVFRQILEGMNLRYRVANDGQEGLSLYKNFKPGLILMDVSMPRMNGLDATKAIREIESSTDYHTPIIGVTAHALKGDMERCLDAGMDDYLSKPVSPETLSEKVDKWREKSAMKASGTR
ncbi:MAG: response regulator, partial [Pseudomonadota bacterium]